MSHSHRMDTLVNAMRFLSMDKSVIGVQKNLGRKKMSTYAPSADAIPLSFNDTYSVETLQKTYQAHKSYVLHLLSISKDQNIKIRLPNMPEHISENIVKFIIQNKMGDTTSTWNCKKGDLYSDKEKQQECKTFTSDGPPSFGPNEEWNVIYFLDARKWLEDKYTLYRVGLSNRCDAWKQVKVSKTQTFEDQCKQNRRPRITWDALYPQISQHCTKVFEGSFSEIFTSIPKTTNTEA